MGRVSGEGEGGGEGEGQREEGPVRMLQPLLVSGSNGSIGIVSSKSEIVGFIGTDNANSDKRKRGKKPKDVKSYVQMNLTSFTSSDRVARPVKRAGRPSKAKPC